MKQFSYAKKPRYIPKYDKNFKPMIIGNMEYLKAVNASPNPQDIKIAIERSDSLVSVYATKVFGSISNAEDNLIYIERLIKTLLWLKGGWKVVVGGPEYIGKHIKDVYSVEGKRQFDAKFMSKVYEKPFTVEICPVADVPQENENPRPMGKNLDGFRIGFDAGGSDRKVSAVAHGVPIFSEEVVWHPKLQSDPQYQYDGILDSMKRAADKLPQVDAIGVSAAGIYINIRVMAASLFMNVPEDLFETKVKNIFLEIQKEMGGVPIEVSNDGDVTALAGAMNLDSSRVLGIAMGTSEAAGYVDKNGYITGWLNELAFAPVDFSAEAMIDEWSGDIGCGVKYFSQDGVIKLAHNAGIKLEDDLSPAEKLKVVQDLMISGDKRARGIYESIGCYMGYALAYYAEFYDIEHVLVLGRVTSGTGGSIIINEAKKVMENEFPVLATKINISTPDEKSKRVGQSVAAASLPKI